MILSSVIIAAPSSLCRSSAPACNSSARTLAATAAVTSLPAFPGTTPTSPAMPVRNLVGTPMTPVLLRLAAASIANSTAALKMPDLALSGLTRSDTEHAAPAHDSRNATRSPSLY